MNKAEMLAQKDDIIKHIINYVESVEYELQANKSLSETQIKNEAVKVILNEIEKVVEYED